MNRILVVLAVAALPALAQAGPQYPFDVDQSPGTYQILAFDRHLVTLGEDLGCQWSVAINRPKLPPQWIGRAAASNDRGAATSKDLIVFSQEGPTGIPYILYYDVSTGLYGAVPPNIAVNDFPVALDVWSPGGIEGSVIVWIEKGTGQAFVWTPSWTVPQRVGSSTMEVNSIRATEDYVAYTEIDPNRKRMYAVYAPVSNIQAPVMLGQGSVLDILDDFVVWIDNKNPAGYTVTDFRNGKTNTMFIAPRSAPNPSHQARLARSGNDYWLFYFDYDAQNPGMLYSAGISSGTTRLITDWMGLNWTFWVSETTGKVAFYDPYSKPNTSICWPNSDYDYDFWLIDVP